MKRVTGLVVLLGLLCGAAVAGSVSPFEFTITIEGVGVWNAADHPDAWDLVANPDGSFSVDGSWVGTNWEGTFDIAIDPANTRAMQASISNGFTLTNLTAATQTFIVEVSAPITSAFAAPTSLFGSVSGAVSDATGSGFAEIAAVAGDPLYTPKLDGAGYGPGQLLPFPFSQQVNTAFGTAPFGPGNFSDPAGPAVNSLIGIRNVFTLTSGDQTSALSTLVVTPEPSALLLLAVGVAGLRRR